MGRLARARALFTPFLALVTAITTTVVFLPRAAGADQISDLKAQAQQISESILQEQMAIGGYQQQVSAAQAKVAADQQELVATQDEIALDQQHIVHDRLHLRTQALNTYMGAGATTSGGVSALLATNEKTVLNKNEYQQLVAGTVTTAAAELHSASLILQAHEAKVQRIESEDESLQAQESSLLQESQNTQAHLVSQQAEVNGALANAIAQQRAAEAAAAAAAVKRAQEEAAAQAAQNRATTVDASSDAGTNGNAAAAAAAPAPALAEQSSGSSGSSGTSLNSFLQCALQAESSGNYGAVSANGQYMGGFQFSQATWNSTAAMAGQSNLIGVAPNTASAADQNNLAVALYAADGEQPWYDPCRS